MEDVDVMTLIFRGMCWVQQPVTVCKLCGKSGVTVFYQDNDR